MDSSITALAITSCCRPSLLEVHIGSSQLLLHHQQARTRLALANNHEPMHDNLKNVFPGANHDGHHNGNCN